MQMQVIAPRVGLECVSAQTQAICINISAFSLPAWQARENHSESDVVGLKE
jgi:hypothetical protein